MNLLEQETQPQSEYRLIPLSQGYQAKIDVQDFTLVCNFKWYANIVLRSDGTIRAIYAIGKVGGHTVQLHRFILQVTDRKMDVDHRDHDTLNCCRHNLRICKRGQNIGNSRRRLDNTSGFKGVHFSKRANAWVVNLQHQYIGMRKTAIEAALLYDEMALKAFGEFAHLNFPKT